MTDPWLIQNTRKNNELTNVVSGVGPAANSDAIILGEQQKEKNEQAEVASEACLEFEDNFAPSPTTVNLSQVDDKVQSSKELQPLPDSASYLQGLERKLQRLKKGTKLVEALAEKRQDCMRTLLQQGNDDVESVVNNNAILDLDTPISNGDSAVQEIYRHLQPVQPVTVGETVHIVCYDHLKVDEEEEEEKSEEEATVPESNSN